MGSWTAYRTGSVEVTAETIRGLMGIIFLGILFALSGGSYRDNTDEDEEC